MNYFIITYSVMTFLFLQNIQAERNIELLDSLRKKIIVEPSSFDLDKEPRNDLYYHRKGGSYGFLNTVNKRKEVFQMEPGHSMNRNEELLMNVLNKPNKRFIVIDNPTIEDLEVARNNLGLKKLPSKRGFSFWVMMSPYFQSNAPSPSEVDIQRQAQDLMTLHEVPEHVQRYYENRVANDNPENWKSFVNKLRLRWG